MTRPRSDDRSGASSRPGSPVPDATALRRELYRPGADPAAVEAYLAAAAAESAAEVRAAADPAAEAGAEPAVATPPGAGSPRSRRARTIALAAVLAVAVPIVGVTLLPRPAPAPVRIPTPASTPVPVAPARFGGLSGGSTLLVALPFRTNRVRVRLECDRRAVYGWTALGEDAQTERFVRVLSHSGTSCTPSATFIGPLPGDVSALRIVVVVEGGPYALSVEPL